MRTVHDPPPLKRTHASQRVQCPTLTHIGTDRPRLGECRAAVLDGSCDTEDARRARWVLRRGSTASPVEEW